MLYHLLLSTTGLAVLLGGWLLVQRLAAMHGAAAPGPGCATSASAPAAAGSTSPACGGCVACGPADAAARPIHPLARDGPAAAHTAFHATAEQAPLDPTRVMP